MPCLIVRARDGTLSTYELSTRRLVIGRAETCEVVLRQDAEVSREHAEIWLNADGRAFVLDRNSKNGTRVDGGELFRDALRPVNQLIRIGSHELKLVGVRPWPEEGAVRFAADPPPSGLDSTRYYPATQRVDLNQQRLAQLMSLTERIGSVFERKQLLEEVLEICCESLGFERALVVLRTPRGDPEPPIVRNVQCDEQGAYKVSRTLINRALLRGERAVVNNPAIDLVDNLSESLVRFPILSALCVPILNRDEILGAIYGDRVSQSAVYAAEDVDFLAAIARQVGVGLANLRLFQNQLRSQKVFAELEQARDIQQNLLPGRPLQVGCIRLAGYNEPSSEVGGDYFDYFELGDGRIGFIIADVTGHGLPAALLMANLQAAVHVALTASVPLTSLAQKLNRLMCRNSASNVFVTAVLGTVQAETGRVEYISAGHPAPIVLSRDTAQIWPGENSLPLGIQEQETYEVRVIEPADGFDSLLFYTDGLIEAAAPDGRFLEIEPILRHLHQTPERDPDALIRRILELVQGHLGGVKPGDDLTLMALQRTG